MRDFHFFQTSNEIRQEMKVDYPAKLRRAACWHLRLRFALMRFVRRDFLPPSIYVPASMLVDCFSVVMSTLAIPAKQKQNTMAVNKYFIILSLVLSRTVKISQYCVLAININQKVDFIRCEVHFVRKDCAVWSYFS